MKILFVFTLLLFNTSFTHSIPYKIKSFEKRGILAGQRHNSYNTRNINSINDVLDVDVSNIHAGSQNFENSINEREIDDLTSDFGNEIGLSDKSGEYNDVNKFDAQNNFNSNNRYKTNSGIDTNTHSQTYSQDNPANSVRIPVPYSVPEIRTVHIPQPYPVPLTRIIQIPVPHPYPVPVERQYPVQIPMTIPVPIRTPIYIRIPHVVPILKPYPVRIPVPVQVPIHTYGHSHKLDVMQGGHGLEGSGHNLAGPYSSSKNSKHFFGSENSHGDFLNKGGQNFNGAAHRRSYGIDEQNYGWKK